MIAFLDPDNLNYEEQLNILILLTVKELMERNHCQSVNEKPRLQVSFGNFRQISYLVILVLWLEFKQELHRNIHSKNDLKHNNNKKELWLLLLVRDAKSGNIGIDIGTDDTDENYDNFPGLVDRILHRDNQSVLKAPISLTISQEPSAEAVEK